TVWESRKSPGLFNKPARASRSRGLFHVQKTVFTTVTAISSTEMLPCYKSHVRHASYHQLRILHRTAMTLSADLPPDLDELIRAQISKITLEIAELKHP